MKTRSRTLSVAAVALAAMLVTPMAPQIVLVDGSGLDPVPDAQAAHHQAQNAPEDVEDAASDGAGGVSGYADETVDETEDTAWQTVGDAWDMIWQDVIEPADDLAWEIIEHIDNTVWYLLRNAWDDAWGEVDAAEDDTWDYAGGIEDSAWATADNVEDHAWDTADRTEGSAWNLTEGTWNTMTQRYWDEHTAEEMVVELVNHWSNYVATEAGTEEDTSKASLEAPPTTTTTSNHEPEDPDPVVVILHGFRPPGADWSMGKETFADFMMERSHQYISDVRRVSYYGGECNVDDDAAGGVYYTSDMDDHWRNSYGTDHDTWFGGNGDDSSHRGVERDCGLQVHDRDTNIRHLAYHVMWYLYDRYTEEGIPVKIAASSMGGILVRYGIAHVGNGVFPPELIVEDVVTVQSPHDDPYQHWCSGWWMYQVEQMCSDAKYGFQWWNDNYGQNPQGTNGTDWTLIGSTDDDIVPAGNAVDMEAHWKYVYDYPQYGHTDPWSDTSDANDAKIYHNDKDLDGDGEPEADPLEPPYRIWWEMPRGATMIQLALLSEYH